MPHNPIRVVVGPANYFSHPGSFNHLHDFFTDEQLSRAVWIYGERAIAAAQTKLPPAFELPGAKHILFRGHCSESDVQQLAAESGDDRSVVIGVGGGALLAILVNSTDTNIIARSSRERQLALTEELKALLAQTPYPDKDALAALDDRFIAENLSPGGSADLLALTWLLHFVTTEGNIDE